MSPNLSWLFETHALKISPAAMPFWYTSGLIGPYYINTQFLCGGAEKATEILAWLDKAKLNPLNFPFDIQEQLESVYNTFPIYQQAVDALVQLVQTAFPFEEIDYISGGERRDWFFAPIVARLCEKSCLYIYNDGRVYDGDGKMVENLAGAKVLNVADLLTVGSSIRDKWIPAIASVGGELAFAANVVDRHEGGTIRLLETGVEQTASLFEVNIALFDEALSTGYIDQEQYYLVRDYVADPFQAMRQFLQSNPLFLEAALALPDQKTRERAKKLRDGNLYRLND